MTLEEMIVDPREVKVNFCGIKTVEWAAVSSDSITGIPRTDLESFGLINHTTEKRAIRDYWDGTGKANVLSKRIDYASDLRARNTRYFDNERIKAVQGNIQEMIRVSNEEWVDVPLFGLMMMNKSEKNKAKVKKQIEEAETEEKSVVVAEHQESFGITGAATIGMAVSAFPVEIVTLNTATSFNQKLDGLEREASTYGGHASYIKHGLYMFFGGISKELARKNNVGKEHVALLMDALCHAFEYNPSATRPEGSVTLRTLFWWNQERELYKPAELKDTVSILLNEGVEKPSSIKDYTIEVKRLPGIDFAYQNYGANIKET